MAYTEAHKKANTKWDAEKVDDLRVRVPKGMRETIQTHAKSRGESVNAFVNRAIAEAMDRDKNGSE